VEDEIVSISINITKIEEKVSKELYLYNKIQTTVKRPLF